jgi:hypothetical protein
MKRIHISDENGDAAVAGEPPGAMGRKQMKAHVVTAQTDIIDRLAELKRDVEVERVAVVGEADGDILDNENRGSACKHQRTPSMLGPLYGNSHGRRVETRAAGLYVRSEAVGSVRAGHVRHPDQTTAPANLLATAITAIGALESVRPATWHIAIIGRIAAVRTWSGGIGAGTITSADAYAVVSVDVTRLALLIIGMVMALRLCLCRHCSQQSQRGQERGPDNCCP